jgi:hypothetical protein
MADLTMPVKLTIVNLDEGRAAGIEAYYNPKEITIDKTAPWSQHKSSKTDSPEMEFTGAKGRSLSMELFFDTYEMKADVHALYVSRLVALTYIRENASGDEEKRPPLCMVVWGGFPPFKGVITKVGTKYTMFLQDGTPVRATCTVTMEEADKVRAKKRKKKNNDAAGGGGAGGGAGGAGE